MTLSIWRYAHLALALISSAFVLILAITGVILAYDAIDERASSYAVPEFKNISLAQSIDGLRKVYPEIIEVSIDHNESVSIDALDDEGNTVKTYIHPLSGEQLGPLYVKSDFIQWVTALHRSLFLKETGRILVGLVSFFLFLITISGAILIIKRQQGLRHFFSKVHRDYLAQYFHVVSGRLLLIPILIIALTGTYLFMVRMEYIPSTLQEKEYPLSEVAEEATPVLSIELFRSTPLSEVVKIEFPFMADDPEDYYVIKLKDRELQVNHFSGAIMQEKDLGATAFWDRLNLDLHTGRTNYIWAFILGLASLNIVFFIYSGFVITLKRSRTKIRNKYKSHQAEVIILVGSENGSTLFFANAIHQQFLAAGQRSYLAEMNSYTTYPQGRQLLVLTSTYGLGTAPSNASEFIDKLSSVTQPTNIAFAVIAFGSKAYADFCAFGNQVEHALSALSWATRSIPLHTVNDRSVSEFLQWVDVWNAQGALPLDSSSSPYTAEKKALQRYTVKTTTAVSADNSTFKVVLAAPKRQKIQSGDLLAIYPGQDHRERLYSVGICGGDIQLMVKLHECGLGSTFLHNLEEGSTLEGRIIENPDFHFPKKASAVAMIANGTGIAPFLGMIDSNHSKVSIQLYAGFRHRNSQTQQYIEFTSTAIAKEQLKMCKLAYSREAQKQYVMDLIRQDAAYFRELLATGGVIMICGSLAMQKEVESVLEEILADQQLPSLIYFKGKNQLLTDCY